jgi:hypothetical protein
LAAIVLLDYPNCAVDDMNLFSALSEPIKTRTKLGLQSLLVIMLIILGVQLHQDYNISSDEQVERTNGIVSLTYLADKFQIGRLQHDPIIKDYRHIPKLQEYMDRDYPVGFNLPMAIIERFLGINDDRNVFHLRHLFTFFFYITGVIALYAISERRFASWQMGLVSAIFLLLTPRFFAEGFYNSKDIVFMSCFAIATATAIHFILQPRIKTAIWHALACALAIDIRIMAVILPLLTIAFLIVRVTKDEVSAKTALHTTAIYLSLMAFLVLLTWPWLWADPVNHFSQAFTNMAKFRWNGQMLFDGRLISSTQLPWNYLPLWITVTTPILYSALFFLGALLTIATLIKRGFHLWHGEQELQDLIFLSLFFAPLTATIVLQSVLYDGWRQMYFIYPAFLLLASKGFISIWRWTKKTTLMKVATLIVMSLSLLSTLSWMIKAHPFQNVYFNSLVQSNWKTRFDLDYWGLANRQALEWILKNDERAFINVWQGSLSNVSLSLKMLNKGQRERISIVDRAQDADYILTNYRLNQADYSRLDHFAGGQFALAHHITVGDEVIQTIFRKTQEAAIFAGLPKNLTWSFANKNNAQNDSSAILMRSGGWATPEEWGVWSKASSARLILPYPSTHPKTLTVNLNAFISTASPVQEVLVQVNSGPQQKFILDRALNNQITVNLPQEISQWVTMNLYFPNAVIPKQHGLGPDDRKLAVGLLGATFR